MCNILWNIGLVYRFIGSVCWWCLDLWIVVEVDWLDVFKVCICLGFVGY